MHRRLSRLAIALTFALTAACGPHRPAADAPQSLASPTSASPAAATVVTSPLRIAETVPLAAQATPAPAGVTPPAEIRDVVFASPSDGWVLTSGIGGDTPTGGDGAIYRTTDGGATWTQVWRGGETSLSRIGLLSAPDHLYASGDTAFSEQNVDGTPLWLTSADGGATWTETEPSLPAPTAPTNPSNPDLPVWSRLQFDFVSPQVGFATTDPEDSYGAPGPIWRTDDGGRTWKALPLPKGFQATGGLDFLDAHTGWITGGETGTCAQLWRTSDGGQTWHAASTSCPSFGLNAVHFVDPEHGFAAGGVLPFIGAQAGILATADGGATWHIVYHTQGPQSPGPITHLAFSTPTQGWAWGGLCKMGQNGPCGGPVLVTHDGGQTWTLTKQGALHLTAERQQAWTTPGPIISAQATLGHTTDGGVHWTAASQPNTYDLCCLRPVPGAPGTVQLWQLSASDGMPGATYTNRQSTAAWAPAPADPFALQEGSFLWRAWANRLFRAGGNGFQVSDDNGRTWQPSPLPPGSFSVADVAFTTPQDGWALTQERTCPDNHCAALDHTQDGGHTWTQAATLPLDALGATLAFTSTVGVVLSDTTVATTTDSGAHWTVFPLPSGSACWHPTAVGASIWLPCRTSAYGGLLLHSTDGGRTWTEQTSRTVVPASIAMTDPTHGWMVAAGQGPTELALYRTTDGGMHWTQTWPALPAG